MPRDFYPRRESVILTFTRNFGARISADAEAFGLSEADVADYAQKQGVFDELYLKSVDPRHRTTVVNVAKREAAVALEAATRVLARRIRANPSVSAVEKSLLGIKEPKRKYTRIARPATPPKVELVSTRGRSVTVRLCDTEHPENRGLPKNVETALLFFHIGDDPPSAGGGRWQGHGVTSRAVATLQFPRDLPPFTKVWVTAQFANPRGEAGPASTPIFAHVPGSAGGVA